MGIDSETIKQVMHLLRPLTTRVANSIARGVVQLVDDGKKLQLVQLGVLAGETVEGANPGGAENFQQYGFSSVPIAGAEVVVVFPNGDRSHPLVIATGDRGSRPTGGLAGEVVMYTDEGDAIRLGRGHAITIATTGTIKLGSTGATDGAIKGTQRDTAEQTFLTAMTTFVTAIIAPTAIPAPAKAAFLAAIAAFAPAASAAISTKVKLE